MPDTLASGARLGPYEIRSLLGAGGMGQVYRARDERLGREVAVKVLPTTFASDPDRIRRFEREARSAAQLNHPNIVAIHDVGVADRTPYLVSELIEGVTLRERLQTGGPFPPRKAIAFAVQIANGLAAAHATGVVHRDLKPENLMVVKGDRLKIVDFGLAKLVRPEGAGATPGGAGAPGGNEDTASIAPQLTETGSILGTASYMAPEQIRQQTVDHRADLFALGAILYEMLTARRAFDGATPMDRMSAILNATPAPLPSALEAEAPGITALIDRCLEKDVEIRFQNAHDLAFALGLIDAAASRASTALGVNAHDTPRAGAPPATSPARDVTFQRLTYRQGSMHSARFSAEGHSVTICAAWDGRPAELFQAHPGNPELRPLGYPSTDILAISRTGEMAVSLRRRARGGFIYTGMLARMPAGGGGSREILDDVREADWSPDGRQLLVLREEGGFEQIEYPIGKVLHRTPGWISHMRLSHDGKTIAFLDHPLRGNDAGGPAILDLSGHVKHLSPGWSSTRGLAWSPDGREILFTAFKTGSGRSLWGITPEGSERLLLRVPGNMTVTDVSRQGMVLFSYENERMRTEFYRHGDAAPLDMSWLDWTMPRAISEDGRKVLLEESGVAGGESHGTYLRDTDGSPAIRLGDGTAFDLSPDGRWAMSCVASATDTVMLYPTGAGETRVIRTPGLETMAGRWLPDGSICLNAHAPGGGLRLHRLDPATGDVRAFSEEGLSWHEIMISPDGRVAAMGPERHMKIYSVDGSPPISIPEITPGDRPVRWSANGAALFVFGRADLPSKVYRVDLATRERTVHREITPLDPTGVEGLTAVKMSADETGYAYAYMQRLSQVYIAEGLFPGS